MRTLLEWIGYAWNFAAIWFLLSVAASPFFLLIRTARARGKRLFATEPAARVRRLEGRHHQPIHLGCVR